MHFDVSISLGNVLTILTLVSHGIFVWTRLVAKIAEHQAMLARHEEWIRDHQECNRKQIEILTEVRESLAFLKGQQSAKEH